jgi:hypothetical protein
VVVVVLVEVVVDVVAVDGGGPFCGVLVGWRT